MESEYECGHGSLDSQDLAFAGSIAMMLFGLIVLGLLKLFPSPYERRRRLTHRR